MSTVIKCCRSEKKNDAKEKQMDLEERLLIQDYRRQNRKIDKSNHSIKSKWFFQITKTCICIVKTVKNKQVTRFLKN